jgi:hypothetical protein
VIGQKKQGFARLEIENNMQPKTLTLVFDDAVNDLACI